MFFFQRGAACLHGGNSLETPLTPLQITEIQVFRGMELGSNNNAAHALTNNRI